MRRPPHAQGPRDLLSYFVLAYVLSALFWLPALLGSNGVAVPEWVEYVRYLGPFGPAIAAFWLTGRGQGRAAMKRLWKGAWRFDFDKRWLIPLFGLPVFTIAVTVAGMYAIGVPVEWEHSVPPAMLVPVFLLIYLTNALPEEYGWRGFALPRLQTMQSALVASLILGALHGLWHLPLHFIDGTTQAAIPIWEFVLKTIASAVIYTWLLNNTKGNLFVATLYHAFTNLLAAVVPYWVSREGRWIGFGVEVVVVIAVILAYGARTLTRTEATPSATGPPGSPGSG